MLQIEIDGKQVSVEQGATVIEAAHKLGTYIPHFCYHKKLSIAANCRMCLVDVEKAPQTSARLCHAGYRRHDCAYGIRQKPERRKKA